ncbi:carboxylate--amine ligase [Planomonospora sphaerica]|uniref:Carboxylate--amine ligase n=1 Tax=Planomonospora sphaerica TaxID=161355 RepID=A0A171CTP4_9ACTN|nr:ATP-binding cassette domain-containing protein [Planomonospora sphaerica]GAT67201.1 carboxylate--amine ligase [Planomonospora sphaerica]
MEKGLPPDCRPGPPIRAAGGGGTAHLLMIESWVGAMSTLLPRAIRDAGHRFTFLTRDLHHYLRAAPNARSHPLLAADNVLTAETNDLPALLSQVERLHDALGFDGVLSSCDYYLPAVAEVAARLGLPGPSPEAGRRACRKDLTRAALQDALSGGELQRAALARALLARPDVLICDEITSGLDPVTQAEALDLLTGLDLTLIVISHDLPVAARIADRVAVVHEGRLIEHGPAGQVLHHPSHPVTRALTGLTGESSRAAGDPLRLRTVHSEIPR